MSCECPRAYPITKWESLDHALTTTGAGPRRQRGEGLFQLHTGKCLLSDELLRVRRR